jgi:hypothetical protein
MVKITEKPENLKSNYAKLDFYSYTNNVEEIAKCWGLQSVEIWNQSVSIKFIWNRDR